MKQYLNLLENILTNGKKKSDRTGTGTISLFGPQMEFDLEEGFPLITTKKIHLKSIIHELLWMLNGDTNIKYLNDNGVRIWNEWADEKGDLGPIYGAQWRNWNGEGIDQMYEATNQLKNNPDNRRIMVNAWNPSVLPEYGKTFSENVANGKAALPPCHSFFQFYAIEGDLYCKMYQRSADIFLGVPFNIASYSLLTQMVGQVTGLKPKKFIHTFGDAHIYLNHLDQVKKQLSRKPKDLPQMILNPKIKNIFDFKYEDFKLENYNPDPVIKATISI